MKLDEYEKILWTEDVGEELMYDAVESLLAEVKRLSVIEGQHRRMGKVLADYGIDDVYDEFVEGDFSFYERLAKAYKWKEGEKE